MLSPRLTQGILLLAGLLACSAWALPFAPQKGKQKPVPQQQTQQPADQSQQAPADQQDQPKPLAAGTVTLKSSRQGKDAASAGYNGLGDDGKVTPTALNYVPTTIDTQKALQLSVYAVAESEVQAFIKEGHLNSPAGR